LLLPFTLSAISISGRTYNYESNSRSNLCGLPLFVLQTRGYGNSRSLPGGNTRSSGDDSRAGGNANGHRHTDSRADGKRHTDSCGNADGSRLSDSVTKSAGLSALDGIRSDFGRFLTEHTKPNCAAVKGTAGALSAVPGDEIALKQANGWHLACS